MSFALSVLWWLYFAFLRAINHRVDENNAMLLRAGGCVIVLVENYFIKMYMCNVCAARVIYLL